MAPFSPSVRTETGTMATSGPDRSSPRSSNQRRSAPAHRARTTSFTFTSWWALMALTAGSDERGRGEDPLTGERSVDRRLRGGERRGRRARARQAPPARERRRCVRRVAFIMRMGEDSERGRGVGQHLGVGRDRCRASTPPRAAGPRRPPGTRSRVATVISLPDAPSMAAWWTLLRTATWPPATPSISHISHRGRLRSSGMAFRWAASSASSRGPPGAGTATWRRCQSMSKSGSSIHSGWWRPKGTSRRRRRNGGARWRRGS